MLRIGYVVSAIADILEEADDGSDCCCRGVCGAVWDLGGPAPKVPSQVNVSFLFPAAAIIGRRTKINQPE